MRVQDIYFVLIDNTKNLLYNSPIICLTFDDRLNRQPALTRFTKIGIRVALGCRKPSNDNPDMPTVYRFGRLKNCPTRTIHPR